MKRLILIASLLALPNVCFAVPADELPDHITASVLVLNPGPTCSATIISHGPTYSCGISAAHCFQGRIGGKFKVRFADGQEADTTLLAIDRTHDLARFAVPTKAILATAPLASKLQTKARYEACGYPSRLPLSPDLTYYRLSPSNGGVTTLKDSMVRWEFRVDNGGAVPGCSGCGVFANGQLCGVLSHNDGGPGEVCYVCPHSQIVAFLEKTDREGCDKWNMGSWSAYPTAYENAPAPLKLSSGKPVNVDGCKNGVCPRRMSAELAQVPPPPPDADVYRIQPKGKPAPQYDGHGRPPEGYRTPHQRSQRIIELENELADLKAHVEEAPPVPPIQHDEGPQLKEGPPEEAPKPEPSLAHAVLCFLAGGGLMLAACVTRTLRT